MASAAGNKFTRPAVAGLVTSASIRRYKKAWRGRAKQLFTNLNSAVVRQSGHSSRADEIMLRALLEPIGNRMTEFLHPSNVLVWQWKKTRTSRRRKDALP
jgi:hypothetical protein